MPKDTENLSDIQPAPVPEELAPQVETPPAEVETEDGTVEVQNALGETVEISADPRDTAEPVEEGAPDVEVKLDPDFEADGDVYVVIPVLPEGYDGEDRIQVTSTKTSYPAQVAAQLAESPAVAVAE